MNDPDDLSELSSISDKTKAWLRETVQGLAVEHDIGGPDLSRVAESSYKRAVFETIRQHALAALAASGVVVPLETLDVCCRVATNELVQVRQIRDSHERGNLPTSSLRHTRYYTAYRQYFDEDPRLLLHGLMRAT